MFAASMFLLAIGALRKPALATAPITERRLSILAQPTTGKTGKALLKTLISGFVMFFEMT